MNRSLRKDNKLDEIVDSVDKAFEEKEDEWERAFDRFESKRRSLEADLMEETQRTVLKELVDDIVGSVEERNKQLQEEMMDVMEEIESRFLDELKSRDSDIQELKDEISSMKEDRRRELKDIHDRIESTQRKIDNTDKKIKSRVKRIFNDQTCDIRSEVQRNSHTIEEIRRSLDDQKAGETASLGDIEDADFETDDLRSQTDEFQDLRERIEQLEEKEQRKDPGKLKDRISKIEEEIDQEQVEKDIFKEEIEDLSEKTEELGERIGEVEEEIEGLTDVSDKQDRFQELSRRVDEIEDDLEDLSEIEVDRKLKKEIVRELDQKSSTSEKPKVQDVASPSEVGSGEVGEEVEVKGRLRFEKKRSRRYFYRMKGENGKLVVASKKRIPEGPRRLEGEVRNVNGNVCLVIE